MNAKKDELFQLRISKHDKESLVELARYYNVSASAMVCMLIAEKRRAIGESRGGSADGEKP